MNSLEAVWRFYSLGGLRTKTLFADHHDFYRPELMPELASELEAALSDLEHDLLS